MKLRILSLTEIKRCSKRARPALPLIFFAVVGVVLAGLLTGCPFTGTSPPPMPGGPPIVRVKISGAAAYAHIVVSGGHRIYAAGREVRNSGAQLSVDVTCSGNTWNLAGSSGGSFAGRDLVIEPSRSGIVYVGPTAYRGRVRLLSMGSSTFAIINHVDIESYLAGVLPKELYPGWSYETYRAVAVAARTFALYQKTAFGPGHDWDLGDTEGSQMYGGYSAESGESYAGRAVASTRGQVLEYPQHGRMQIFLAQYSAACGGVVNGAYVIRSDAPYDPPLKGGQQCTDCRACPHFVWGPVNVSKRELYSALAARYPAVISLGGVQKLQVASQTPYGRAVWMDVVGPSGQSVRLRAEDVRLAWNMSIASGPSPSARRLWSMNCGMQDMGSYIQFVNGHGYGHGVGLCQWGAQGKALAGWKGEQILAFYYPGASIIRVW